MNTAISEGSPQNNPVNFYDPDSTTNCSKTDPLEISRFYLSLDTNDPLREVICTYFADNKDRFYFPQVVEIFMKSSSQQIEELKKEIQRSTNPMNGVEYTDEEPGEVLQGEKIQKAKDRISQLAQRSHYINETNSFGYLMTELNNLIDGLDLKARDRNSLGNIVLIATNIKIRTKRAFLDNPDQRPLKQELLNRAEYLLQRVRAIEALSSRKEH